MTALVIGAGILAWAGAVCWFITMTKLIDPPVGLSDGRDRTRGWAPPDARGSASFAAYHRKLRREELRRHLRGTHLR